MANSRIDLKYIARLVEDSKKGDSNAFASLFAITYNQQYNLAYSYLWDKALAQDVVFALYLNTLMLLDNLKHSKDFIKYMTRDNMATCEALAAEKGITPPKGKVHVPPWPIEDAKTLLEYVFFEAHYEQNSIPLEVLVEHNNYQMRRYGMQKFMVVAVIILFAALPFSFIMPKFSIVEAQETEKTKGIKRYDINVENHIPIKTVKASIAGDNVPVFQSGRRSFYVLPEKNGKLSVTVTYITHRHATESANVTNVDHKVPSLKSYRTSDNRVILIVSDKGGVGIDYKSIFALDENKNTIKPSSYNSIIGEIIFPFPKVRLDAYIPDKAGNTLHAVINNPNPAPEEPALEEEASPEEEAPLEETPEEEYPEEEPPAEDYPEEEYYEEESGEEAYEEESYEEESEE